VDYVPTSRAVVFGHHFTSIAGTGPIVGPAIAIMWGWLPALLWVLFGSIFIGAVHDLGSLVVSLRNNGQTVGDIAGRLINRRVRILFLLVLFMALTLVLAVFGMVIASAFQLYPASIFPCTIQLPIAVIIGYWIYRRGGGILVPSIITLALMYLSVIYGDVGILHAINGGMADLAVGGAPAGLLLRRICPAGVGAASAAGLHQLAPAHLSPWADRGRAHRRQHLRRPPAGEGCRTSDSELRGTADQPPSRRRSAGHPALPLHHRGLRRDQWFPLPGLLRHQQQAA
jgi:hypothetical protein